MFLMENILSYVLYKTIAALHEYHYTFFIDAGSFPPEPAPLPHIQIT